MSGFVFLFCADKNEIYFENFKLIDIPVFRLEFPKRKESKFHSNARQENKDGFLILDDFLRKFRNRKSSHWTFQ